ncbi:MAG TPA: hypothetical protein VNI36_07305 [Candidatus Dormibacteraeota bacterium]|nr:hypothetical protein [Candidatus Dormibacteraeota bacterium]
MSGTKSRFDEATATSGEAVRLKVTGVDVKGQMFRHSATVLMLDGCDCVFRSESQPELDGSVLVEFDYPKADPLCRLSQARVKSNQAEIESGFYKVVVELEVAQTVKVVPGQVEPQTVIKKPALQAAPASSLASAEGTGGPVVASRELPPVPKSNGIPQPLPGPNHEGSPTINLVSREPLPRTQAENPIAVREAVKSAVASEIKQEINLLRSWISSELERSLPAIVSSKMEKMIGDALEKQISVNYEAAIQALNADVTRQVGDRIAESKDLRSALEGMMKKLFEEQAELSRTAGVKVEQEISTRAATTIRSFEESVAEMEARINTARADMEDVTRQFGDRIAESKDLRSALEGMAKTLFEEQAELSRTAGVKVEQEISTRAATTIQSFEESVAEMEARINTARADMEDVLTKSQIFKQEINDGMHSLHKALEQFNNTRTAGIEKLQGQVASQLSTCATQFENQLNKISTEKAVQFSMEMEKHQSLHQQRADETVEKLGAMLQLLQRTARVQQERLTEHSLTTTANFDKEIRAVLLRLAGGA